MKEEMKAVNIGLLMIMLALVFGVNEDSVKSYIAEGVAAHPEVHDEKSNAKIWRYAQRSHFHATGIAAFSMGLVILIAMSSLKRKLKTISSILIGLGGLYPLSWFTMFLLAPSIGRSAAHHHIITQLLTYIAITGLLLGLAILCANLFLNKFEEI